MAAAESVPAGTEILPGRGLTNGALTVGQQALWMVAKISLGSGVATKSTEDQHDHLLSKAFLESSKSCVVSCDISAVPACPQTDFLAACLTELTVDVYCVI